MCACYIIVVCAMSTDSMWEDDLESLSDIEVASCVGVCNLCVIWREKKWHSDNGCH